MGSGWDVNETPKHLSKLMPQTVTLGVVHYKLFPPGEAVTAVTYYAEIEVHAIVGH